MIVIMILIVVLTVKANLGLRAFLVVDAQEKFTCWDEVAYCFGVCCVVVCTFCPMSL